MIPTLHDLELHFNPLDILEEFASAHDWRFDRSGECELISEVKGRWCDYVMCFFWQSDISAVLFSCHVDQKIPWTKRRDVHELLAAVNETLWLGHFDVSTEEGLPMYRHTILLRGAPGITVEQLEDMVDTAMTEWEQFYPAMQLVLWGGRSVDDALKSTVMETVGEA